MILVCVYFIKNLLFLFKKIIKIKNLDFSDETRRRKGYRSGNYVLQIDEPAFPHNETVDQKFQRLRLEIEELTELVNTEEKVGNI